MVDPSLSPNPLEDFLITPYPPSIHDDPLFHYPTLIAVLTRSSARRAVEQRMRAEGIRLTTTPIRVINEEARAYLRDHPELVQEVIERVQNVSGFRTLAEREARDRARKRKQEMKRR
jgi:hypothetical protein